MPIARLDRTVFDISGETVLPWLEGLITNSLSRASTGEVTFAALLTPQGKIIADFFITPHDSGVFLDTPQTYASDLKKRLMMYKLREKITITQTDLAVYAAWDGLGDDAQIDPRLPALGHRILAESLEATATAQMYNAHRLSLGVPDSSYDFTSASTFPANANMDLLCGVDFKKGCFVGQEVVSRMHRKTEVRKRMNAINCPEPVEAGAALMQGEVNVGSVLSAQDQRAMALVRFDRLSDSGEPILAGSIPVTLTKRAYGDQT